MEGQIGSVDFVQQRRAALERWLQQLAAHPVIGASDVRTRDAAQNADERMPLVGCFLDEIWSGSGSRDKLRG